MAAIKVKSGSEWIEVPSFSVTSIPEAPTDGKQYARQNANWTEVLSGDKTNVLILSLENDLANGQKDSPVEAEVSTALKDAITNGKACVIKSANSDILANLQQISDNVTIIMEQISRIGQTFVAVNTTITVNTATNVISDYQTGALVLETEGDGSKFLSNDGKYKEISQPDLSNYLAKNNTTEFTPTEDYNPATKKYVDKLITPLLVFQGDNIGGYELTEDSRPIYDSIPDNTIGNIIVFGGLYFCTSGFYTKDGTFTVFVNGLNGMAPVETIKNIVIPPYASYSAKLTITSDYKVTINNITINPNSKILTESEYSALGEAVNTDGVLYFVTPDA